LFVLFFISFFSFFLWCGWGGGGGGPPLLKGELFDRIATSVGRFEHFWGFPLERGHYT